MIVDEVECRLGRRRGGDGGKGMSEVEVHDGNAVGWGMEDSVFDCRCCWWRGVEDSGFIV